MRYHWNCNLCTAIPSVQVTLCCVQGATYLKTATAATAAARLI